MLNHPPPHPNSRQAPSLESSAKSSSSDAAVGAHPIKTEILLHTLELQQIMLVLLRREKKTLLDIKSKKDI